MICVQHKMNSVLSTTDRIVKVQLVYQLLPHSLDAEQTIVVIFQGKETGDLPRQKFGRSWAVMVAKWSACSPSTPTIRIRIPKKLKKFCLKRTKIRKKEAGVGTLKKHLVVHGSYLESFNNLVIIFE